MKTSHMITAMLLASALLFSTAVRAHEHDEQAEAASDEPVTLKGEIVDLACYLGHGAHGEKHAECAQTCIESGLPVGLKAENGTTYILIGEHKPMNATLAKYAAKTVTVKGKVSERDGMHLLSNVEIIK